MLLQLVGLFFGERTLTNTDGHFEYFYVYRQQNHAWLRTSSNEEVRGRAGHVESAAMDAPPFREKALFKTARE
jgi:hypothetical protein